MLFCIFLREGDSLSICRWSWAGFVNTNSSIYIRFVEVIFTNVMGSVSNPFRIKEKQKREARFTANNSYAAARLDTKMLTRAASSFFAGKDCRHQRQLEITMGNSLEKYIHDNMQGLCTIPTSDSSLIPATFHVQHAYILVLVCTYLRYQVI